MRVYMTQFVLKDQIYGITETDLMMHHLTTPSLSGNFRQKQQKDSPALNGLALRVQYQMNKLIFTIFDIIFRF